MSEQNKIGYEQTIDGGETIVLFSYTDTAKNIIYKGTFVSEFRKYAQQLNEKHADEDVFFFARALDEEGFKTVSFVVPHHPISEVFAMVANKWADEAGYPFLFVYKPKGIGMINVTFPSSLITAELSPKYGVYTENRLKEEIKNCFASIVIEPLADKVVAEDELEELDLERLDQYRIIEDDEDDKKGDEFVSSLNDEEQIEKGADSNE